MKRFPFLDWMRGLAVVVMIQCHAFNAFARLDTRDGGPYVLSQFVGGMAAPLFLFMAGMTTAFQMESLARIPVEVEYASELRYRNPPMDRGTLLFAITQSGETADTLAALREIKRKGFPTLAICNVVGSTIAQEADGGIYLHAGAEIGVASTKAFTS